MVQVTTEHTVELDALLERARQWWRAWRVEHPQLTEQQAIGLNHADSQHREDEFYEATRAMEEALIPLDRQVLLALLQDERVWDTEAGMLTADHTLRGCIRYSIMQLMDEIPDVLDGFERAQ
jgi:hypothetical protein